MENYNNLRQEIDNLVSGWDTNQGCDPAWIALTIPSNKWRLAKK